jgi:hypothetical protein
MNYSRLIIAIMFFVSQNNYFGWNLKPMSDMELLTDGIALLLLSLAFAKEDKT